MSKFGYDINNQEAKDLIDSVDLDGDGELGFDEFCKLISEKWKN